MKLIFYTFLTFSHFIFLFLLKDHQDLNPQITVFIDFHTYGLVSDIIFFCCCLNDSRRDQKESVLMLI